MSETFHYGPGVYDDLLPEIYHSDPTVEPSLSASVAHVVLTESPWHAWHAHPRLNPNFEREESNGMDLGSAAHASFLCGNTDDVVWVNEKDWRKDVAKKAREDARENGMVALLAHQQDELAGMLAGLEKAIAESEWAETLSRKREVEQSFFWQERNGIWCRSRLDLRVESVIFDYKLTTTANPGAFINGNLCRMGYDTQAGFYRRAVDKMLGIKDAAYVWIVQENKVPFDATFVGLGPQMKEMADDKADQAIKTWAECMRTGKWPAYTKRTCWAEPPTWALYQWAGTPTES